MGDKNPNDLARKARDEITSAGIRKVLKGESDVRLETLVVLAKALDTTAPLLLLEAMSGEEDEHEDEKAHAERAKVELFHIGEMYTDIPRQCQKDVMDLLTVLQNNHSLSRRRERLVEHRETITRRHEERPAASAADSYRTRKQVSLGYDEAEDQEEKKKAS